MTATELNKRYGAAGRVGIGTPQANPTVEPELSVLLPDGVAMFTTRLISRDPDPKRRVIGYFDALEDALQRYDGLPLDAYGFACTGSSYCIDPVIESAAIARLEDIYDFPIVTAAAAIAEALGVLHARRVALCSPYPDWLSGLSQIYWQQAGFEIVACQRIETPGTELRGIYTLSSADAEPVVRALAATPCDAIVLTGTGMPSLPLIAALQDAFTVPMISSNLCLAAALMQRLNIDNAEQGPHPLINGWQARLARL